MAVYDQELDNMVRWDLKRAPFYEVYFLKFNFAGNSKALWLRYTLLAPRKDLGAPSASVWAMYYDRDDAKKNLAIKETVAIDRTVVDLDIFYFQILENAVYNSGARGQVSSGGNRIRWDLQFIHNEESFRLYPALFYHTPFPKTKLISPNWSIQPYGELQINDRTIPVIESWGTQTHLWGSQHADRWAWAHCNTFEAEPGAVFEALTAQVKLGGRRLRPLTMMALRLADGKTLKFNRMIHWVMSRSEYSLEQWTLSGHRGHWLLKVSIKSLPAEMMGVTYTDTDGSKLYCYHGESADFQLELLEQRGGRYHPVKQLRSHRAGAFEVVERAPLPALSLQL